MAFDINGYNAQQSIRSYEISIWTLQDKFLSVMKWANMSQTGQLQNPEMPLRDDGTEELSFTVPKFYWVGAERINNPMWLQVRKNPIEANMHKLKVIFNKTTEHERVFEFLVTNVDNEHTSDEVDISVKAEGLAFHELGKVGYKLAFSQTTYELDLDSWIEAGAEGAKPEETIQYWNDKIFRDAKGNWRTNWTYEVQMDWSSYSQGIDKLKDPHKVYEDEYVSSWQLDNSMTLQPKYVEGYKEKWRPIEVSESNIYNITQTIAEQFGVFCRYEYGHDENYQITTRKVIYYNNYIQDMLGHIDLTYPYSSTSIKRTVDSSEITTKLYVQNVDNDTMGTISIMEVDANKSKEDYLLCFDYLKEIEGINEEQYNEIEKYEALMHQYNNELIQIQERIRIITNQLVELEAQKTTYTNAITLDEDRLDDAIRNIQSITGGKEWEQFDTPRSVMKNDTYGLYVTMSLEGVQEKSLQLYRSNNFMAMDSSQYKTAIKKYSIDLDETGEYVVRVKNLQSAGLKEGDIIYISGLRNPYLYYEKLQEIWSKRKLLDTNALQKVEDQVNLYNWYLTGSRVGYARVGEAQAGLSYMGLAMTSLFDESEEELMHIWDIEHPFISTIVEDMRIGNTDDKYITSYDIDVFKDDDINSLSADLYYFREYYLNMKAQLSDRFERMMGPALREGYWQPDDYHDYGDMYEVTINNLSANGVDPINQTALNTFIPDSFVEAYLVDDRTAPHLQFLWDCNKYYENETAAIYDSSISGRKDQHLIIDISDCLPYVQKHLSDLRFFYSSPSSVSTIYDIQNRRLGNFQTTLRTFYDGKYPNSNNNGSVAENHDDNPHYYLKLQRLVDRITSTGNLAKYNKHTQYFGQIASLKTKISNFRGTAEGQMGAARIPYYIAMGDDLNTENINLLRNTIIPALEEIADTLYALQKAYKEQTTETTDEAAFGKAELEKITMAYEYLVYINSSLISGESALTSVGTANDTNNFISPNDKGLLSFLRQYLVYLDWLDSLQSSRYQSYGLNSECQLGWVIDTNPIIEDNQIKDYGKCKRIPVLIVTGANTLDDDTIRFITTGHYAIYNGEGIETTKTWSEEPVGIQYRPFLGYYKTSKSIDGNDEPVISTIPNTELNEYIQLNMEHFIGVETDSNGNVLNFGRDLPSYDYDNNGYLRPPEPNEYRYRCVYPRLFFNTLKLKNASDELRLMQGGLSLENFKDYSVITDDRSIGQRVFGAGYYCTIKPHIFFKQGNKEAFALEVIYTLSNADVSIYLDALKVSRENAKPKVSYEVELSVLNPEFIKTAYDRLNQIVHINDNDLQLEEASGYISSLTLSLDKPWEDKAEIKNYTTKFEDLFSTIVAQTAAMQKSTQGLNAALQAFSRTTGLLDADILERSMWNANLKLKFDTKGTITSEPDGIWARSEDGIVAFKAGGIFTSSEIDSDGQPIWNTGILPSGINASLITSGQLDTNKIKVYAGDELRFQLNGDGLFAYKYYRPLTDAITETSLSNISAPANNIDANQYVVFNTEGLFLTAKKGTYYSSGESIIKDGRYYLEYLQTTSDIDRVEVSWQGFKLRNWAGQEVFYADPDTGNLYLEGSIKAESGEVGGWTIYPHMLSGEYINFIGKFDESDTTNSTVSGIYVTKDVVAWNIVRGIKSGSNVEEAFYECKYNTNQIAYYTAPIIDAIEVPLNQLYTIQQESKYVVPKYTKTVSTSTNENEVTEWTDGDTLTTTVTTVTTTVEYIMTNAALTNYALDENDQPIIYDGNNNLTNNSWYTKVKNLPNYTSYINISTVERFVPVSNATTKVKIYPTIEQRPSFRVNAQEGKVYMYQGQLANFTFDANSLKAGTLESTRLRNNNLLGDSNNNIKLGMLFYDGFINEEKGELTLKRVNGESANFNVAKMRYVKDRIAAASKITLTIKVKNGSIIATAQSGSETWADLLETMTINGNG